MDESRSEVRISQRKIVVRDLAALGSPLSSFYPPSSRSHFAFFSSRRQARYLPSPLSLSHFFPPISVLHSNISSSLLFSLARFPFYRNCNFGYFYSPVSFPRSFFFSLFFLLLELTTRSNKNIHFDLGFVIYRWT